MPLSGETENKPIDRRLQRFNADGDDAERFFELFDVADLLQQRFVIRRDLFVQLVVDERNAARQFAQLLGEQRQRIVGVMTGSEQGRRVCIDVELAVEKRLELLVDVELFAPLGTHCRTDERRFV